MYALVCISNTICILSLFDKLPKLLIQDDMFEVNVFGALIK